MHAYTHMDLDLKDLLFITKTRMGQYIFVELCNIKFHENLLSCYQFVTFMQTETDTVKITGTVRKFSCKHFKKEKKELTLWN